MAETDLLTALAERRSAARQHLAQYVTYAGVVGADYATTQIGIRRGLGAEGNPAMSCGGQICGSRYLALNAAVGAGMVAIHHFAYPHLNRRGRKAMDVTIWLLIAGRGAVVVHNIRAIQ